MAESEHDDPVQAVSRTAQLPSTLFHSSDRERERHLIELKRLRLPGFVTHGWPGMTTLADAGFIPPRRPRPKVVVNVTAATPRKPKARFAAEATAGKETPRRRARAAAAAAPAGPAPRQQTITQKMSGARGVIAPEVEDPVSDEDAPVPRRPTPRSRSSQPRPPRPAVKKPQMIGLAMHMSDSRLNSRADLEIVSDDEEDQRPARRPRAERKPAAGRSGALGDVSNRARRPSKPSSKLAPSNSQVWISQAV